MSFEDLDLDLELDLDLNFSDDASEAIGSADSSFFTLAGLLVVVCAPFVSSLFTDGFAPFFRSFDGLGDAISSLRRLFNVPLGLDLAPLATGGVTFVFVADRVALIVGAMNEIRETPKDDPKALNK